MVRRARDTFRFDPHLAKGAVGTRAIWARNIMVAIAVSMVVAGVGAAAGSLAYWSWSLWADRDAIDLDSLAASAANQLVGPVERRMQLSAAPCSSRVRERPRYSSSS